MRGVTLKKEARPLYNNISTHTPHARRDKREMVSEKQLWDFYSHASCEAWPTTAASAVAAGIISTHTPHARRDQSITITLHLLSHFYSHASCEAWPTLPSVYPMPILFLLTRLMRGVTTVSEHKKIHKKISTHTPHARRDAASKSFTSLWCDFYSHASCEAWLNTLIKFICSTCISTHTPHARRDIFF